jgi:parallel beta-helix repeat protein
VNNTVLENTVSNSMYGIYLNSSIDNIVSYNTAVNNTDGISLTFSLRNTIINNDVMNNEIGINLSAQSYHNNIYHNYIINNTIQAIDDSNNNSWNSTYYWDSPNPSGGNYWSDFDEASEGAYDDYQGMNQFTPGSDGIVDNGSGGGMNPYIIDSDSMDHYPLTQPVGSPQPPADTSGPIISGLKPPHTSLVFPNPPTISANYSDESGINVSSVVLKLDDVDVTSSATITATNVSYLPPSELDPYVTHYVYLEVEDTLGNMANVTWYFNIDYAEPLPEQPPSISNMTPSDQSTIDTGTPTISADYIDPHRGYCENVTLLVNDIDITSLANATGYHLSYTPTTELSDGVHTVYLEVTGTFFTTNVTWSFTVDTPPEPDTTPPTISNLQPVDQSTLSNATPEISADYTDDTQIDVSSVVVKVDGTDVTSSATVTESGMIYIPSSDLADGTHTVYVEVSDNSSNQANISWSFTVDTSDVEPDEPEESNFLSDFWWLILIIIITVILLLFIMMRKKKAPGEEVPSEQVEPEEEPEEIPLDETEPLP